MTNHRIPPKPVHFELSTPGTCRWCNRKIGLTPKGRESKSTWHRHCLVEYKLLFWPSTTRKAVWKRDKGRCNTCTTVCTKSGLTKWHMDHIIPLIQADGNLKYWQLGNLQTLCKPCHTVKTSAEATARAVVRRALKKEVTDGALVIPHV